MQTDLVPSISAIMGLPIPSGNTGKLIKRTIQNLNINKILFAYHYNTQQIYNNYILKKGSLDKGIYYIQVYYNIKIKLSTFDYFYILIKCCTLFSYYLF